MNMMRNLGFFLLFLFFIGCGSNDEAINEVIKKGSSIIPPSVSEYGFDPHPIKNKKRRKNPKLRIMFIEKVFTIVI